MAELLGALFEGVISLVAGLIEAIAGVFTAGGEAMGAGEAIIVFILFLVELVLWLILFRGCPR